MVEFRSVTHHAIEFIAARMRESDAVEVMASSGSTPIGALTRGVGLSDYSVAVYIDNDPCMIYGLVTRSTLALCGVPWALSSVNIMDHRRDILRWSPGVIDKMLDVCPYIVNHVHADNKVSVRWLKWLGFTIEEPAPFGVYGCLFHRFSKRRG